jgi:CBS domain-containing protein
MSTPATPVLAMLVWLGYVNIAVAAFNMMPGFPMDGGRILRAVIWWATGNAERATRAAAMAGQSIALGFIVLGLFSFFAGAGFSGLWIAFIGWFLLDAARMSYAQVEIYKRLRGVRVADVMNRDYPTVDSRTNLQAFAEDYLLRTGTRCFIVVENNRPIGMITPHEVKQVEEKRRPLALVGDVMRPFEQLRKATPDMPIIEALETMAGEDLNQLPVTSDGHLEGMLSRSHILQLLQTRKELQM